MLLQERERNEKKRERIIKKKERELFFLKLVFVIVKTMHITILIKEAFLDYLSEKNCMTNER